MVTIPSALTTLQPATSAAWQRALDVVLPLSDERLLALAHERLQAAQQRQVCEAGDCSEVERQVIALADQFAVDVNGVTEGQIAALTDALRAEKVNALVNGLYLIDMGLRLEQVVPVLLPGNGEAPASAAPESASPPADQGEALIADTIAAFAAAAVLADGIDAVTSELVRLRCAQVHHCRLCGSLRQRSALDEGFDEDMAGRIARYEQGGFSEAQTAALRLVDTLIMFPADAGADLRAGLERHYTPAQVAELCFDVVKWSQQKALVATHIDAPPWEGIHVLDFDGDGHPLFAGPMADATQR
jgi:hypothetical protein